MNIAEFHDALKNKKTSVREVTISYLEKIKKASPVGLWPRENAGLNAYLEVFEKEVVGKPEEIKEKILKGKLDSYLADKILLEQPFIKDGNLKVKDLIGSAIQKFGEKIEIGKFVRFSISGK